MEKIDLEKIYTSEAILQMYNIEGYTMKGVERFIQYMGQRGVELELVKRGVGKAKSTFRILSAVEEDPTEEWRECPQYPTWEFSNHGHVRNSKTKKYYGKGQKASNGYYSIAMTNDLRVKVHRGVMMSFSPIEKPENFVVDHIDGNRGNNNLSNLRWVFQKENARYSNENNTQMKEIIAALVQNYGYDKTIELLNTLLPKEKSE